jgi:hypothetical protein
MKVDEAKKKLDAVNILNETHIQYLDENINNKFKLLKMNYSGAEDEYKDFSVEHIIPNQKNMVKIFKNYLKIYRLFFEKFHSFMKIYLF